MVVCWSSCVGDYSRSCIQDWTTKDFYDRLITMMDSEDWFSLAQRGE